MRLRRSMLITPGNRPERIAKAATLDADCVVLDLEDSIGPEQKPEARHIVADALGTIDFGRRERLVRINAVGTAEYEADLPSLNLGLIDALFVPKVESADALVGLATWLDAEEARRGLTRRIEIVATIETPRGLFNALEIAEATKRTTALFFGSGDYTAATGSAVTERALAAPRALIVAAAAAAGIEAIDAAFFTAVKDVEAARADAKIGRELGFAGKLVFHPGQIAAVNEVFTPNADEIARARRIVEAYNAAKAEGRGTAYVDGTFIAIDIALMAERVLARAKAAGAV
jgi:citrate lyase beta subunit